MTAGAPRVSIVLPVHDGARFLREAIDAVLGQTLEDWELLIVDDASTDGSPGIIAEAAARDPRVCPLRHNENRRLPAALNNGFAAARGEYLTWTSDDNRFRNNALATLVEALGGDSKTGVVYADYTRIDEDGRPTGRVVVPQPEMLAEGNCVGPCFLYRREVSDAVGPYAEDLFLAEDLDFWLRASLVTRLRPLHQDLYLYRMHPGTLTARGIGPVHEATYEALTRTLPRMLWLDPHHRALGFIMLARLAQENGDLVRARSHFLTAARLSKGSLMQPGVGRFVLLAILGKSGYERARKAYRALPWARG
jgi:glycosyltransferase involved in cell wall biosynthesis